MTGPEFAHAHGDDSSTWTLADIEAQQNLAANDLHTVWVHLHPTTQQTEQHTTAA